MWGNCVFIFWVGKWDIDLEGNRRIWLFFEIYKEKNKINKLRFYKLLFNVGCFNVYWVEIKKWLIFFFCLEIGYGRWSRWGYML